MPCIRKSGDGQKDDAKKNNDNKKGQNGKQAILGTIMGLKGLMGPKPKKNVGEQQKKIVDVVVDGDDDVDDAFASGDDNNADQRLSYLEMMKDAGADESSDQSDSAESAETKPRNVKPAKETTNKKNLDSSSSEPSQTNPHDIFQLK